MNTLRRIAQCESGGVTVEFVLWMPIYIVLFMMVFDSSLIFAYKNRMEQVAQNAARQISVGAIRETDLDTFIQSQGFDASAYSASVTKAAGSVTVSMAVPTTEAEMSGVFSKLGLARLTTTVSQRSEM